MSTTPTRPCNCDLQSCRLCYLAHNDPRYAQLWGIESKSKFTWSYGLMTVPKRRTTTLEPTLQSLTNAGFGNPHLFIDGCNDLRVYEGINHIMTVREISIGVAGNWVLGMYELYYRNPWADRYVMFQDDMTTYRNLKQYLESVPYPEKGYCNLYTTPHNQKLCGSKNGWYRSNQKGIGALALMFDRDTLCALLSTKHLAKRPWDQPKDKARGFTAIDGGVVDAMKEVGVSEYVHNPSLVQHTGMTSTMSKKLNDTVPGKTMSDKGYQWHDRTLSRSFKGEQFDALQLKEV